MKEIFKNKVVKEVTEWIICFVIAYVIYLCLNFFIGTIAGIKQSSMYPTAEEGERVLISRRVLFNKEIKRGDIVTIEAPIGTETVNGIVYAKYPKYLGLKWFTYEIMEVGKKSYIKRVVALGGDHIYIAETGEVYLNEEILEEDYLVNNYTPRTGEIYDVVVPIGYVFVMGDNRMGSKDSRELGLIPVKNVEGKVVIRIWPLNKIGEI